MMTQKDRWDKQWQDYMDYLKENGRRPSKYKAEDRRSYSWYKHTRKLLNRDALPADRKEKFARLLAAAAKVQRVNQYQYVSGDDSAHSGEDKDGE